MDINNINILNRNECTGCLVCYQVCPHDAIQMIETKEGFHYPYIIEEKCTNCRICVKKCHALNDNFKTEYKQEIYEVIANDEIRMKSSSGGAFSIIANYVLENNGYVCGASFTKDWLGVEHIIINDEKDLYKLRGSKYIESDLGSSFIEIKKLLNDNNLVLFSGCPCQVSALYSYLGKDYNNLITVDLLCNSIVPQKVWKKYLLETFSNEELKEIEYISFRDKSKFGWGRGIYIKFKNGNEYIKSKFECIYNILFTEHISSKPECLKCNYRSFNRVGDISIGDSWWTNNSDGKGNSIILINSKRMYEVLEYIKINSIARNIDSVSNGGLLGNIPIFSNRKYFFDNLDNYNLLDLYKESTNPKYNVAIVNMCFQDNYGAALTYYSLYKIIEYLGYNPIIVYDDKQPYVGNNNNIYDNANGNRFALSYMNIANESFNEEELKKLNDKCDTFLVGSDQVWRYRNWWNWKNNFYFLFNFVSSHKKKIAYSSSFGLPYYEADTEENIYLKYFFNQFDDISVREDDGINICKECFDVEATHVLDPVFLFDDYDFLIRKSKLNIKHKYLFSYLRRGDKDLDKYLDYASNQLSLQIIKTGKINDYYEYDKSVSVEDWLYMIKNCDFFISDSFHGICFAIIFNKPFILVINDGVISKYASLIRMFNIESRTVNYFSEIVNNDDLYQQINFSEINEKIDIERKKSINWLKNALNKVKMKKVNDYKEDVIRKLINDNKILYDNYAFLHNENLILKDNIVYLTNRVEDVIIDRLSNNWIKLFGIYNNENYIYIYFLGIRFTLKITSESINKLAWWIPIKKWREDFRSKFKIRPDQTRPDQTRPNLFYIHFYLYNKTKNKKIQPMLQYSIAA